MDRWKDRQIMIDGGRDTLTERRIDGQMDRCTHTHTHTHTHTLKEGKIE